MPNGVLPGTGQFLTALPSPETSKPAINGKKIIQTSRWPEQHVL